MSLSRIIVLCLSLVLFCGGCTRLPGGIAASNIPLTPGSYIPIGEVSATDCKVNLLGIIPVSGGNQLHQALDKAKRKENADALIEITVDVASKFFILWSQTCTEVRATAVRVTSS